MPTMSELLNSTGPTVRIAVVKPANTVLFTGEVAAVQTGPGKVVLNEEVIKAAFPGGQIVYITPEADIAEGYVWDNTAEAFVAPPNVPRFLPYEIFALFTEAERTRYFAALDAANVNVRTVAEMFRLQSGMVLEGTHPVVQSALYILRSEGIIDNDARLTELGAILQGI